MAKEKQQDMYDLIANAPIYGGGLFFREGRYRVKIRDCKDHDSKKDEGVTYKIIECEVVETTVDGQGPGDIVTQRIKMTEKSAPSNVKQFLLALGQQVSEGFTEEDIDRDMVKMVFEDWQGFVAQVVEQGCIGEGEMIQLKAEAHIIKTRKGTDFTKVTWYPTDATVGDDEDGEDLGESAA